MILKTAIWQTDNVKYKNAYWVGSNQTHQAFICNCGAAFYLNSSNPFRSFDDIMCRECKKQRRLLPQVGERWIYRRIRKDAAEAKREFSLTREQVAELIHLPCHYCGRQDCNVLNIPSKSRAGIPLMKDFRYNGIDRVDNAVGYTIENVVPCCMVCNRAKNSMSYREFIEYLAVLVSHRSSGKVNHDDSTVSLSVGSGSSEGRGLAPVEKWPEGEVLLYSSQFTVSPVVSGTVRWTHHVPGPSGEFETPDQETEQKKQT